jgi:RNA polymerase sigma-70 factor (ECF subfamily)
MADVVQPASFPETRWSLILRVRARGDQTLAAQALNDLCQAYWQPLYIYLRRSGLAPEAAEDIVQGFLAQMLSNDSFERVAPAKGRFRHFLLATLRNYLISQARRDGALKRGGEAHLVPLNVAQAEELFQVQASESLSPEVAFDRQWAQTVWTRALQQLRAELARRGKERMFDVLKVHLTEEPGHNHDALAAQLGVAPGFVALTLHRLRRRLRELVMDELAETVGEDGDLREELEYFLSIWSK